ncbi:MAG TPA: hypothetical protein ENI31_05195 [Candidatus Omnitrophica bacterium]|nr:MAG: hypothetical protein DRP61_00825 [Candidatus Omnitrophota bacterium]RKY35066.1 MAG: hypothetical protein DRP69_02810 [Candidatus Omnitrophota bacterium]RKY44425.1 MAG: hypothetical protein DRP80_02420 [Candidatus Omnitrophota bacterium]HEC69658.1 hypothetical protein [Candidatus Omnitrophota bacterium]
MSNKFQISNFKFQIIILSFILYSLSSIVSGVYAEQASSSNYEIEFINGGTSLGFPSSGRVYLTYFVIGEQLSVPIEVASTQRIINFGWSYYWPHLEGEVIYEIAELGARTHLSGFEIPPSVWQRDNDPYFYWTVLISPPTLIKGFSFSLDSPPDKEVDTEFPFYQYSQDSLSDGKHTFYIAPYVGGETWGKPLSFEIWVDTSSPSITELTPASSELISRSFVEVSCKVEDLHSGLNLSSLQFFLNGEKVSGEFDEDKNIYSYKGDLPDGENTVLIKVEDNVGSQASKAWSFIVDTHPPQGSVVINNDDPVTNSSYVTLKITASDEVSGIKYIYISNDGVFDTEMNNPFEFRALIENWLLKEPDISGRKTVYIKFEDYAGNVSSVFSDDIELVVLTPDTRIISAPPSLTPEKEATFYYQASYEGCLFSYSLDGSEWSPWEKKKSVSFSDLGLGVHLFKVKAGLDIDGDGLISLCEEDPTPAQWTWTVREEIFIEKFQKILFFRRK